MSWYLEKNHYLRSNLFLADIHIKRSEIPNLFRVINYISSKIILN